MLQNVFGRTRYPSAFRYPKRGHQHEKQINRNGISRHDCFHGGCRTQQSRSSLAWWLVDPRSCRWRSCSGSDHRLKTLLLRLWTILLRLWTILLLRLWSLLLRWWSLLLSRWPVLLWWARLLLRPTLQTLVRILIDAWLAAFAVKPGAKKVSLAQIERACPARGDV